MNTQFSLGTKIKVGIIGFGRMGRFYWDAMRKSGRWDIAYICDTNPASRELAKELSPESYVIEDNQKIFEDESVQVVGLFTLADSRMEQIEKAIRYGKHIIAEKPVADTMENEWKVVEMAESSDVFSTVNLYLRNSWYHNLMKEYIRQGEIGELAIIRICHMTPGLAPGEGHEYEGPAFHDCGMHYVDIARSYAGCEYRTWNAQGVNMWNYKDPWWIQHFALRNLSVAKILMYCVICLPILSKPGNGTLAYHYCATLLLHPNMHGNSSKTHICTTYRLSVIYVRLNKSGNEEKI